MKNNSKGFLLIELLVSLGIVLTIIFTFLPIIYQIKLDEQLLSQRREIQSRLHDELQAFLRYSDQLSLPNSYETIINNNPVLYSFTHEQSLVKGCVTWNNERKKSEQFCLFGSPEK